MSAPYTIRLDQEAARELATRGATLLFLGMPEGCALGIDQQTFLVGPRFQGVKMVPPGAHVISYSASSGQGDFGPTTCFFLVLKTGQVVVRRWSAAEEVLQEVPDEDEVERYIQGVKSFQFDSSLAPYDLLSYNRWRELTNCITAGVVDTLQPLSGNMSILAESDPAGDRPETAAEEALTKQLQEGRAARAQQAAQQGQQGAQQAQHEGQQGQQQPMVEDGGGATEAANGAGAAPQGAGGPGPAPHAGRCYYTPLPRLVKRAGLSPAELTALNLDKSPLLEELLHSKYRDSEDALLGEFQFCFLAFLLGQSLEGFAQWRAFLQLLFGCESAALGPRAGLFARFLRALHTQLEHSMAGQRQRGNQSSSAPEPATLFAGPLLWDELLRDSFLRKLCTRFLGMLHEERAVVPAELAEQAQRVGMLLGQSLGWGVAVVTELGEGESGDDDDGPVLVENVEEASYF